MALTPSGFWHGLDGNWSTFKLSLGPLEKPSSWQSFHVLVSTSSHQIKVPFSSYCKTLSNPWGPDCGHLRGVRDFQGTSSQGFEPSESETWSATTREDMSIFAFNRDEIDNRTHWSVAPGEFFHGGRELKIEEADPAKGELLGSFGMSAIPASIWFWMPGIFRFTRSSVWRASFLQALTFETILPAAYGYTAGAAYQNAPASLTIGYYNSSLLLPGARSFAFSRDHDLKVHLASIQASETPGRSQNSILAEDIPVLLDSSEPYLQFPEVVCREFQNTFGLEYELETGLFLVNSSTRARLRELNPSLTFALAGGVEEDGSTTSDMEVVLPYSSFDLEIKTAPHTNTRAYFPLKIVADDDFSVLGRTFFQEAYLIVNYPYNNFTISQRSFTPIGSHGPNLTRIHAEVGSSGDGPFPNIVIGIVIIFAIFGFLVAIPFLLFYAIPEIIISALFDKPRARRIEKRQKELEKLWGKIHGD